MRRCAFLTLDDQSAYVIDDDHAHEPLRALGWQVESVPWRRAPETAAGYDVVVIRSTYDYVTAPEEFIAALSAIARAGVPLHNSLELVRWNHHKTYLPDLEARGVPVVPTLLRRLRADEMPGFLDELGHDEIVIKPLVGANASGAYRLDRVSLPRKSYEVEAFYAGREAMVQPFVPAVVTEGEYSLVYFNGEFSHALLKTPRAADFRVQEEHGGRILSVTPEPRLRAAADRVMRTLDETPLYARVDLVRAAATGDDFWLMELELIEPSLYFRMSAGAAERFARALHERAAR
ncbi:MAG TPA: hypothetical protein VF039_02365 [Longimicrobiales bacterium]